MARCHACSLAQRGALCFVITCRTRFSRTAVRSLQRLKRSLIDFVVEQTGYPAEIVELDVDLEADLGNRQHPQSPDDG